MEIYRSRTCTIQKQKKKNNTNNNNHTLYVQLPVALYVPPQCGINLFLSTSDFIYIYTLLTRRQKHVFRASGRRLTGALDYYYYYYFFNDHYYCCCCYYYCFFLFFSINDRLLLLLHLLVSLNVYTRLTNVNNTHTHIYIV